MSYPLSLHANSPAALNHELRRWGAVAPDRLERRGRQRDLERWIFSGFLRARFASGTLEFPVSVAEDENPDFRLTAGLNSLGIEVTVAVDTAEQARWTKEARVDETDDAPAFREVDLNDPTRRVRVVEMVQTAHEKKCRKCSAEVDALLMYLNTEDSGFEKAETLLSWLNGAIPSGSRFKFVWVFDGSKLFELKSHKHLATLDVP